MIYILFKYYCMLLYVSCYIKIYDSTEKDDWRIDNFKLLLKTGINIMVFISKEYENKFILLCDIYSNLSYRVIDIYKELLLFINKPNNPKLPDIRNENKDTYEYMALMNSKLEFIMKVIDKKYDYYAWIDFSITYIFNELNYTLSYLSFLSKQKWNNEFIYIPGCWNISNEKLITDYVYWRFCGGFFMGDKESIINFYNIVDKTLKEELINKSLMVWEVNIWSFIESNKEWCPSHWYKVNDHNDDMIINIPTELYISPLSWLNDKSIEFYNLLPKIDYFHPSSISYCVNKNTKEEYLICRMINYELSDDGRQYIYLSSNKTIENINILINLTKRESIILCIEEGLYEYKNSFSRGLEDIRIYENMTFTANSISFTNGITPQIIYGKIDEKNGIINNMKHIKTPSLLNKYECEKNWIFIEKEEKIYVIYRWYPFEIGILENDKIVIDKSLKLQPEYIFKDMRGSTIFIEYSINRYNCIYNGDWLIGIIHYSIDQDVNTNIYRKYFHCLVLLNKESLIPKYITSPFTFLKKQGIEYCIGMRYEKINGIFTFWVSIMDNSPREFYLHEDKIDFNISINLN